MTELLKNCFIRRHTKADGRKLHLFGWEEHTLPITEESPPVDAAKPRVRKDGSKYTPAQHTRWHPVRREWVTYSPARQTRTFLPPADFCPLCPTKKGGFASEIPFENFEIAVFRNKFPAFIASSTDERNATGLALDLSEEQTKNNHAKGTCEVVIYSADHEGGLATLGQKRRELLVCAWIDRYNELYGRDEIKYVLPFENRGEAIGVTLHHPHGQIYAMPFIPPVQTQAVKAFESGFDLYAQDALTHPDYVVDENDTMVQYVPPFARFPFESWIVPKTKQPGPWTFNDAQIRDLAAILGRAQARYDALFDTTMPYIMALNAAPKGMEDLFPFHIHFYPYMRDAGKLKYLAGIEQGGGAFMVDMLPEDMAAKMQNIQLPENI